MDMLSRQVISRYLLCRPMSSFHEKKVFLFLLQNLFPLKILLRLHMLLEEDLIFLMEQDERHKAYIHHFLDL